jgi:hypothetical protein
LRKGIEVALMLAVIAVALAPRAAPARADSEDLSAEWIWCDGNFLPAGRISSINITIRNVGPSPVKLQFVGLHFDWMPQNAYVYGGGSELEAILPPGGSARYAIPFEIPPDAQPGPHECLAFAKYEVLGEGRLKVFRPDRGLSVLRVITVTEVVTKTETVVAKGGQEYGYAALAVLGLAIAAAALLLAKLRLRGKPGGGAVGG